MKARGYAAFDQSSPLEHYEFDRREVGAGDVAIDIKYCGVCHSDIHLARDEWGGAMYPVVPGHEIAGVVTAVGNNVTKYKLGDKVGVGCLVDSCRTCGSCNEGLENYCENGMIMTYNSLVEGKQTFGGYSNKIVVSERFVLRIPDNLDLAASAPLLCAGITTYSPLKYLGASRGQRVAILGLGGLGHMGVKLAKSFGCDVSVLSHSPQKREDALKLGADEFILTSDKTESAKVANHFDIILDTVSAKHNLEQALGMLKRDGTLIMVGLSEKPLDLVLFPLILGRRRIFGSVIGGLPETQEMLDHCGRHNITSDIELVKASQINEAWERTVKSDVKYRFVIDCSTF